MSEAKFEKKKDSKKESEKKKEEPIKEEPKKEEPKKAEKKKSSFDLEKKIKTIRESKMTKEQQNKYIEQISPSSAKGGQILFSVYCRLKKISAGMQAGMQAHPKAKGIQMASVKEWDEIFKGFFGKKELKEGSK